MRISAAKKPISKSAPRASSMADDPQPIDREQSSGDHGEEGDALDHVGKVDGHAGRAGHGAGAVEDDGKEEGRRNDAERIELGQCGDDDAGVAIAGGEVGGYLVADAADLAGAGKAGK